MSMKKKTFLLRALMLMLIVAVTAGTLLTGCGKTQDTPAAGSSPAEGPASTEQSEGAQDTAGQPVVAEWEFPMLSVLTGAVAFVGKPASWAIQYAAEQINAEGGIRGVPVKITEYDTAFDTAKAITAMTKVVDDSLVVFGPMDGPGGDAAGQVAADEKVPFIAAVSFPDVREKYKPYGIAYMTDSESGDLLASQQWLKVNPDIKSVVIFYTPTDPSIAKCYELCKKGYEEAGIKVAGSIEVQTGQLDLGSSVVKALNYKADGYQLLLRTDEFVKAAAEFNKRGMKDGNKILGTFSSIGPQLFELGKENIENCYLWNKMDEQYPSDEWNALVEAYKQDFEGQTPSVPPVPDFYNALYAVKDAIETLEITGDPDKLEEERQAIAEYLFNSKEYEGIQGPYKWIKGEKIAPVHFFQIKSSKLIKVEGK
jgi:branched-chain amino acid transport system substrate-binding protein